MYILTLQVLLILKRFNVFTNIVSFQISNWISHKEMIEFYVYMIPFVKKSPVRYLKIRKNQYVNTRTEIRILWRFSRLCNIL